MPSTALTGARGRKALVRTFWNHYAGASLASESWRSDNPFILCGLLPSGDVTMPADQQDDVRRASDVLVLHMEDGIFLEYIGEKMYLMDGKTD